MVKKTSLLVAALLLFAVLAGIAYSQAIPPPPPPPVNQNLGLYDTSIEKLQTNATDQSACRACHQSSGTNVSSSGYNNTLGGVDTRHHNLLSEPVLNPFTNQPFGCQDCHPTVTGGNGVLLDHSCQDCHNGTNFWGDSALGAHVGNFSRPHHVNTTYDDANIGNPAANRTCNLCHGSFVDNYNDGHYVPTYASNFTGGVISPTSGYTNPIATWKITSAIPNPIPVFDSGGSLVANKTWGGCESCHDANPAASPFPIGSNHDNHHKEILGFARFGGTTPQQNASTPFSVANACSVCHVIDEANITGHGNTFPLRMNIVNTKDGETLSNLMEVRNSTIEQADIAAGAIEASSSNGIVTVNGTGCEKCHDVKSIHNIQFQFVQNGQQGLGHINNNSDCYGCHNSWLPQDTWTPGPLIPYIDSVTPSVIPAGTAGTITLTGSNFVNPDGQYPAVVTVDGVSYTPTSISGEQLTVDIQGLTAGIHQLQLVKGQDTLSKLYTLTVVNNPSITSATYTPASKGPGTITVTGTGFGNKPVTNAQYYISVNHAGTQIISQSIQRWSNTQIIGKISGISSGDTATVMTVGSGEAQKKIQ